MNELSSLHIFGATSDIPGLFLYNVAQPTHNFFRMKSGEVILGNSLREIFPEQKPEQNKPRSKLRGP
jgi:hypothetical protein